MGAGSSKARSVLESQREVLNERIYNAIVKSSTTISSSQTTIAKMKVVMGIVSNCDVELVQDLDVTKNSDVQITDELIVDINNETNNLIDESFANKGNSEAGGLVIGSSKSSTDASTKLKEVIKNITKTSLTKENMVEVKDSQFTLADQEIIITGCLNSNIAAKQNVTAAMVSTAIVTNLFDNISNDKQVNDLTKKVTAESKSKSRGALAGLVDLFTNPYFLIAIVICAIIALLIFKESKNKK